VLSIGWRLRAALLVSALLVACDGRVPTGHTVGADPHSSAATSSGLPILHSAPGLPPGDYTLVAERPGIVPGSVLRTYGQLHLGYPVAGYGMFVESKDGIILSKNGKLMAGLAPAYPTPMSQAAALEFAWRALELPDRPPWVTQPAAYHAPTGQLALVAKLIYPTPKDFVLARCFVLQGSGIGLYSAVEVDAATGELISRNPGSIQ